MKTHSNHNKTKMFLILEKEPKGKKKLKRKAENKTKP